VEGEIPDRLPRLTALGGISGRGKKKKKEEEKEKRSQRQVSNGLGHFSGERKTTGKGQSQKSRTGGSVVNWQVKKKNPAKVEGGKVGRGRAGTGKVREKKKRKKMSEQRKTPLRIEQARQTLAKRGEAG